VKCPRQQNRQQPRKTGESRYSGDFGNWQEPSKTTEKNREKKRQKSFWNRILQRE
jgi:hypothetical protein